MEVPVSLRFDERQRLPATAAVIRGGDAATWLRELSRWPGDALSLRLYVVPGGLQDRPAAGLLVVPSAANCVPDASPRLQLYTCLAESLYVPLQSRLEPPLEATELSELLIWPVSLLHPSIGLIGFDHDDALDLHTLLAPPPTRAMGWYGANPGLPPAPSLQSVRLQPDQAGQLLREESAGIGSREPQELPPEPDSVRELGFADRIRHKVLKGMSGLRGRGGAGGEGGLGAELWDWVSRRIEELDRLRQREVDRLLNLLERDPDEGLKYAMPLANRYEGRGVAEPSQRLGKHKVDFDASALGGGQAGDAWQLEMDDYRRLRERYVQAAQRELNLGRQRRAAYIFAHLLGDYHAAANVLEQGGYWQEAALIYREHLHWPVAAAGCLTRCGLLQEAAELYMAEQQFERAGDLYRQLEQEDEATTCYRHAVASLIGEHGDPLAAARVLEEKLEAPDEALETLLAAWPGSAQGERCLAAWFERIGERGKHDQARRLLQKQSRQELADRHALSYLGVLAELAVGYPDDAVQARARDQAKVLIGKRLQKPLARTLKRQLVEMLPRLRPDDPYLNRDALRFTTRPDQHPRRKAAGAARLLEPVHRMALTTEECQLLAALPAPNGLVALSQMQRDLQAVRATWSGQMQRATWYDFHNSASLQLIFGGSPQHQQALIYSPLDARLPERHLPPLLADGSRLTIGTPQWLDPSTVSVAALDTGFLTLQRQSFGFVLCEYSSSGRLLVTRAFDSGEQSVNELTMQPRLSTWSSHIFLSWGQRLWWLRSEPLSDERSQLPIRGRHIACCPSLGYPQLAVAGDERIALLWPETGEGSTIERLMIDDISATALGFLPNGNLVVAERTHARCYRISRGRAEQIHDLRTDGTTLAVLPVDRGHSVALVNRAGQVTIFEGLES